MLTETNPTLTGAADCPDSQRSDKNSRSVMTVCNACNV